MVIAALLDVPPSPESERKSARSSHSGHVCVYILYFCVPFRANDVSELCGEERTDINALRIFVTIDEHFFGFTTL